MQVTPEWIVLAPQPGSATTLGPAARFREDHVTSDVGTEAGRAASRLRAMMRRCRAIAPAAIAPAAIALACRGAEDYALYERMADRRAPETDGVSIGIGSSSARFVNTVMGLRNPESVRYDPAQDAYFISNMAGYGSVKDATATSFA